MSEASIDSQLLAFARAYEKKTLFREDRLLGEELAREAQPVIEALTQSLSSGVSIEHAHEACALVTLLLRRAALLAATPTAAVALVDALVEAVREGGFPCDEACIWRLRVLASEGYSGGRDERLSADSAAMLRAAQVLTVLAPRCVCAFLSGKHEPERLSPVLVELGRLALRHDAASCLVDLSRLDLSREDIVRVVFDGLATIASLGVVPVLYVPPSDGAANVQRFAPAVSEAVFCGELADAVHTALVQAGHDLRPRRRWGKELFTRAKTSGSRS